MTDFVSLSPEDQAEIIRTELRSVETQLLQLEVRGVPEDDPQRSELSERHGGLKTRLAAVSKKK
jgi:hypothetical protein